MIFGGDYSLWDEVLDWPAHIWPYAFIKCSEGIVEDPVFRRQWLAAKGHVYRGAYHFFRPLVPWKTAADKLLQLLARDGAGELPPVLDLEVTNGVSNDAVCNYSLEWLHYVHKQVGVRPIVYTSPGFSNTIRMWRYADYADFPLWQATYPWDEIGPTWSEENRKELIHDIIKGVYAYKFPVAARPWEDVGRRAVFVQWTAKCPPEFVPGYPLGGKKAVDVNVYRGNLEDLTIQFNLSPLQGGDVSVKPITWTAQLLSGQKANLRSAAGLTASVHEVIIAPLSADLPFQGTGTKIQKDGYYWAEVVLPKPGWIAFTTSFVRVRWLAEPPVPPVSSRKLVRAVLFFDDESTEEMFPKL